MRGKQTIQKRRACYVPCFQFDGKFHDFDLKARRDQEVSPRYLFFYKNKGWVGKSLLLLALAGSLALLDDIVAVENISLRSLITSPLQAG